MHEQSEGVKMRKFFSFIFCLLMSFPLYADVVSLDSNYVEGQADLVSKLNNDRTALTNGVNNIQGVFSGSAQSSGQIKADTIGEENMADDANPRIRSDEGASCSDFVVSGLLPATTSGTLVGSIPAGTAYPDGYRIAKTSSTAKLFTANKWTYIDLDINGSFQYEEQTIGGSTPAVTDNSARLARVSTDSTQVVEVQDLRKTSCTAGPFNAISDVATGASLADIFQNGKPIKDEGSNGFIQGLHLKYNDHTTFTVTGGSAYINGEYRFVSQDITVPQTADSPSNGTSGVDTSVGADSDYNVFVMADQEGSANLAVTYSTSASPAGVTNFRKIGEISTDASSLFTSFDISKVHNISQNEIIGGWVNFDGTASGITPRSGRNITSITDNGQGDYTVTWGDDFSNAYYAVSLNSDETGSGQAPVFSITTQAVGSIRFEVRGVNDNTVADVDNIQVIAIGEM